MRHTATSGFWRDYHSLPREIRDRADKQFLLLKVNEHHPSLQFKSLGERRGLELWSVRVSLKYRALAIKRVDGYLWFWIGDHKTYDVAIF